MQILRFDESAPADDVADRPFGIVYQQGIKGKNTSPCPWSPVPGLGAPFIILRINAHLLVGDRDLLGPSALAACLVRGFGRDLERAFGDTGFDTGVTTDLQIPTLIASALLEFAICAPHRFREDIAP